MKENKSNWYRTIDELWIDALRVIIDSGYDLDSRAGKCRELVGFQGVLTDPESTFLLNPRRRLSPSYACAEFLWYMSPDPRIDMIAAYAPQYVKFAENGVAHGAYGYRIASNVTEPVPVGTVLHRTQLDLVVQHLKQDRNSRQAIVTPWNANDLVHAIIKDHKDLPCTISLQFLLRDDKLHLVATMRSNDAWLGLPYDAFCFTCIQRLVAQAVGVAPGVYVHQAGSEHLYQRNWEAAREAIATPLPPTWERAQHDWSTGPFDLRGAPAWNCAVDRAQAAEKQFRDKKLLAGYAELTALNLEHGHAGTMLRDVAVACGRKWGAESNFHSQAFKIAERTIAEYEASKSKEK